MKLLFFFLPPTPPISPTLYISLVFCAFALYSLVLNVPLYLLGCLNPLWKVDDCRYVWSLDCFPPLNFDYSKRWIFLKSPLFTFDFVSAFFSFLAHSFATPHYPPSISISATRFFMPRSLVQSSNALKSFERVCVRIKTQSRCTGKSKTHVSHAVTNGI